MDSNECWIALHDAPARRQTTVIACATFDTDDLEAEAHDLTGPC